MPTIPYYDWIAHHAGPPSQAPRDPRPADRPEVHLCRPRRAHRPIDRGPRGARHRPRRPRRPARAQLRRILRAAVRLRPAGRHHAAAQLAAHRARAGLHPGRLEPEAADPRQDLRRTGHRPLRRTCSRSTTTAPTAPTSALSPRPARRPRRPLTHDDVGMVMYTSGTTGHPEGRDHHPRDGVLELREPRHPGADHARDGAARGAAAVPHRRAQLLRQPGAACRRHDPDHAHLRSRPGARLSSPIPRSASPTSSPCPRPISS